MPEYQYEAIDNDGVSHRGKMRATNVLELERSLQSLNLELIKEKELKERKLFIRKLPRREMINFLINLQQLIDAGVPILDGLKDIRDSQPKSAFRDILANLIELIEGGATLSESMAGFPTIFDEVTVSLIRVGEESGQLGPVVEQLAESLKWTDEILSHAKKIMIYPAIVGTVVFGVVCFLMIYLVPQLIPFIMDMGGTLPGHTKALIWVSELFTAYWYAILPSPFVIIVTLKLLHRHNATMAYQLDKLKLKIPLLGPLLLKLKVARFSNYFALMYGSGITVIEALKLCDKIMDNLVLTESVVKARTLISDGKLISESFAETQLFPPLVVRMLKIGENTGGLDVALRNVSYFYSRDVQEAIDKIEPALEPIMTVTMGGIMMWIMVAVLGPVYDIISQL